MNCCSMRFSILSSARDEAATVLARSALTT
jgi:hypothetical protein